MLIQFCLEIIFDKYDLSSVTESKWEKCALPVTTKQASSLGLLP